MSDENNPTRGDQDNPEEESARRPSPVLERDVEADPHQDAPEQPEDAPTEGAGEDEDASEDEGASDAGPDVGGDDASEGGGDEAGEAEDEEENHFFDPTPQPTPIITPPPSEEGEDAPAAEATSDDEDEAASAELEEEEDTAGEDDAAAVEDAPSELDTSALPVDEAYVADLLAELGEIAGDCGLHSLEDEITDERLPALRRGRVTLVVLGEFNHGKSTVINALLGNDILPVGITPTTAVITHLVHAERPTVTIKPPHNGEAYTIEYNEMERAVRESGEEGEEPEYVEIGYPNEVLGNSLVLVDTPGVNDISRQKVEITYGYLPRADVVVYVLDATQVLKKSEVTFIRDRLLKANRDRIIFVLNKVDALSPEDVAEVEQYARERLEGLIGPVEIFSFSGRLALDAQRDGRAELPGEFARFRDYLMSFLQEQRAYIILDSSLAGGLRVSGLLEQNLAIKRQGYKLEKDELERRIRAVRAKLKESRRLIAENTELIDERINGIAATARHNLRVFSEQFAEQLPIQVERAEAGDVKKYLPNWIRDTFKDWLEGEGQEIARNLEELAEEIIEITNESLKEAVETYRDAFGLSDELDLDVDTVAYDVSVFALGAFGVSIFLFANMIIGSLLTLATPLLAFFLKEKVDAKLKERARDEGVAAIEAASERLEEELLHVIHDYGDRLKNFVETAGDRLYRQIEEVLEQVQEETAGDVDREALLADVEDRLTKVRSIGHVISTSREKLAEWATEAGFHQATHQH